MIDSAIFLSYLFSCLLLLPIYFVCRRFCTLPSTHHPPFYHTIYGKTPALQLQLPSLLPMEEGRGFAIGAGCIFEHPVLMQLLEDSSFGDIL